MVCSSANGPRSSAKCGHCELVQYVTPKNTCRRCGRILIPDEEEKSSQGISVHREKMGECIGTVIRSLRKEKGFSERKFAEILGVPRTYIGKVETGRAVPRLPNLERLARGLDLSVFALVGKIFPETHYCPNNPFMAEILSHLQSHELSSDRRAAVLLAAKRLMAVHEFSSRPQ